MVRLGLLGTVHDIVVSLCAQERADTVAKVTAALLTQQEVAVVVQITNALVASGHVKDAVAIGSKNAHTSLSDSVSSCKSHSLLRTFPPRSGEISNLCIGTQSALVIFIQLSLKGEYSHIPPPPGHLGELGIVS